MMRSLIASASAVLCILLWIRGKLCALLLWWENYLPQPVQIVLLQTKGFGCRQRLAPCFALFPQSCCNLFWRFLGFEARVLSSIVCSHGCLPCTTLHLSKVRRDTAVAQSIPLSSRKPGCPCGSVSTVQDQQIDQTDALFLCSAVHRLRNALEDTESEFTVAAIQGTVERMLSSIRDLSLSLEARVNFYEASLQELNSMAEDLRALVGTPSNWVTNEDGIIHSRGGETQENRTGLERPEAVLPIFKLGDDSSHLAWDVEAKKECRICLEGFNTEDDVCFLNCTHLYHATCICQWIQVSATCPACRMAVD